MGKTLLTSVVCRCDRTVQWGAILPNRSVFHLLIFSGILLVPDSYVPFVHPFGDDKQWRDLLLFQGDRTGFS